MLKKNGRNAYTSDQEAKNEGYDDYKHEYAKEARTTIPFFPEAACDGVRLSKHVLVLEIDIFDLWGPEKHMFKTEGQGQTIRQETGIVLGKMWSSFPLAARGSCSSMTTCPARGSRSYCLHIGEFMQT